MKKNDLNKLRTLKDEIKTALLNEDYDKAMEGIGKLEDFINNNKGNCIFCDFLIIHLLRFIQEQYQIVNH